MHWSWKTLCKNLPKSVQSNPYFPILLIAKRFRKSSGVKKLPNFIRELKSNFSDFLVEILIGTFIALDKAKQSKRHFYKWGLQLILKCRLRLPIYNIEKKLSRWVFRIVIYNHKFFGSSKVAIYWSCTAQSLFFIWSKSCNGFNLSIWFIDATLDHFRWKLRPAWKGPTAKGGGEQSPYVGLFHISAKGS